MASPDNYPVVVARLTQDDDLKTRTLFMEQYQPLMNAIRGGYQAAMISDVKHLDLKSKNRPKAILMVTNEVTKAYHVSLRAELARYVETGGTLILCCWFISQSTTWEIEGVLWEFKCGWEVKEGLEKYVRTGLALNPALRSIGDTPLTSLEDSYPIQAVHLQGVAESNKLYYQTFEELNPEIRALDPGAKATPSAFRKHGRGFLGYVGDVVIESGTQALILAMLEAATTEPNKQNYAGPSYTAPNNLTHAAPPTNAKARAQINNQGHANPSSVAPKELNHGAPSLDNMAHPVLHNDPSGPYPPVVRQAAGSNLNPTARPFVQQSSSTAILPIVNQVSDSDANRAIHSNLQIAPMGNNPVSIPRTGWTAGAGARRSLFKRNRERRDNSTRAESTPSAHSTVEPTLGTPTFVHGADSPSNQQLSGVSSPTSTVSLFCDTVQTQSSSDGTITERVSEPVALLRFEVDSDGDTEQPSDDTYGGAIKTPSIHSYRSYLSGPPSSLHDPDLVSEYELNAEGKEIGEASGGASNTSPLEEDDGMPTLAPCNPGCAVCTILYPSNRCTGCRKIQYCSVACQTQDWPEHKAICASQKKTFHGTKLLRNPVSEGDLYLSN